MKKSKRQRLKVGYYPDVENWIMCDKNGKTWQGAPIERRQIWEVNIPGRGGEYTVTSQFQAELLYLLYDIRVKLEKVLKKR